MALALELEQVLAVSQRSTGSSGLGSLLLLWRAGSPLTGEWPSWDELVVLEHTQDLQKVRARKRREEASCHPNSFRTTENIGVQ